MVAVLSRILGVHNLALAEDVAQDAFCRALEVWKFRGMPENPSAWLMATAKNRALDILRQRRTQKKFIPELEHFFENDRAMTNSVEDMFEPSAIKDSLLGMMFSCCHSRLREDAQIALVLNILCGFSVKEIAGAFVDSIAAVEKRLARSKKTLATSSKLFDVTSPENFLSRLPSVHRALYLLFNEGYHGASPETAVRAGLCAEAMRLTAVLLDHHLGATPESFALAALMSFGAARLPARVGAGGQLLPMADQDRSLWDQGRIREGQNLLNLSASGDQVSTYHLEAAIASQHALAPHPRATDWTMITQLYDSLAALRPNPIVFLNRAIAIAWRDGPERGLQEILAIADLDRLASYPFLAATRAELELQCGRSDAAVAYFTQARDKARNAMERQFYDQKIKQCGANL